MKAQDDIDLVFTLKQMAEGHEKAYRQFYLNHYNDFIKFGRLISDDVQLVEDAIQNILIWFIENPKKVKKLDRPDLYLFRAMRNNLIREVNSSKDKSTHIDLQNTVIEVLTAASPESKWMEKEVQSAQRLLLQEEIDQLPDYLKQTLYLRYFSNLSYPEISKIMNIQTSVARIYIHRAVERLRKTIQKLEVILWLICFTEL